LHRHYLTPYSLFPLAPRSSLPRLRSAIFAPEDTIFLEINITFAPAIYLQIITIDADKDEK
jgi:hypothetical protein